MDPLESKRTRKRISETDDIPRKVRVRYDPLYLLVVLVVVIVLVLALTHQL